MSARDGFDVRRAQIAMGARKPSGLEPLDMGALLANKSSEHYVDVPALRRASAREAKRAEKAQRLYEARARWNAEQERGAARGRKLRAWE